MIALITGASAGIGATFARHLAALNYDLVLVARRKDRLEELAREVKTKAEVIEADLTREEDLQRVEARLTGEPAIDLLVNNAGFGTRALFWKADLEGQDRMHRLHVIATMRLTHAALRAMEPRGEGAVINVSSVAAFIQGAGNISYCATKAWMNNFTLGLAKELKSVGSRVRVQALCPGFTYTEFHDVMEVDRGVIPSWAWMDADAVVKASLEGLRKGKLIVVPGALYRVVVAFLDWLPGPLVRRLPNSPSAGRSAQRGTP